VVLVVKVPDLLRVGRLRGYNEPEQGHQAREGTSEAEQEICSKLSPRRVMRPLPGRPDHPEPPCSPGGRAPAGA
jgi:hypothetical protein